MSWIDVLIIFIPLAFVMYMGFRARKYVRSVADFLSAGRVCGRYVISVADVANGLAIILLVAYVEVRYKTGFGMLFWSNITLPIMFFFSLTGYCVYRFRETKAMSLGQFLEMRYSRTFRIFASTLRTSSEILANMICPAIAARFFIYFFDLPHEVELLGFPVKTFSLLILIVITLSVTIIWFGGTIGLVITDTIQGLICYPVLVVFTIFVLSKFSWTSEIIPVMNDRVAGESFLNPYDLEKLRDFNVFALAVGIFSMFLNHASWLGAGNSAAGRSPHEQKMAGVLGAWRTNFSIIFYILLAITVLTFLNHRNFAQQGKEVKTELTSKITQELEISSAKKQELIAAFSKVPAHNHTIGVDRPLSQERNLDSHYLDIAKKALNGTDEGAAKYQEFYTLYHQVMLPVTMRHLLPVGLTGLFCLLMIMMMISTDDSRIFSSALTLTQDVIVPLKKKPFTPQGHIRALRLMSVGVGAIFFLGSSFMAQLDYINMFMIIMTSIWLGGAGSVMIFGLYSRFGTTAGAFASLITGMFLSIGGVLIQRGWAGVIYPWLQTNSLVEHVGGILETVSSPFNPYIQWKMSAEKCPINSYEFYFFAIVLSVAAYCLGSLITYRKPFNLERMLHRGKYSLDHDKQPKKIWTLRNVFGKPLLALLASIRVAIRSLRGAFFFMVLFISLF